MTERLSLRELEERGARVLRAEERRGRDGDTASMAQNI